MPEAAERFIDIALRALDDNAEMKVGARHQLEEAIAGAAAVDADPLEKATATLEKVDRGGLAKWWKVGLYAVMATASAVVLGLTGLSVMKMWPAYTMLTSTLSLTPATPMRDEDLGGHLGPKERRLLLGDTSKHLPGARMKALWDTEPENPAFYADYVIASLRGSMPLPPDFLTTARELDADNGWFLAMAAGEYARDAIDQSSRGLTKSPKGVKIKVIKDAAKADEALALLAEASTKSRFDSYQTAMLKRRIPLLPPRTDTIGQMVPLTYIAGISAPNLRLRQLSDLVSARALELSAAGDRDGFLKLLGEWERFSGRVVAAETSSLVDVLVALVTVRNPLKAMLEAATDLGLTEEAARLKALDDRFEVRKRAIDARTPTLPELKMRASTLAGLSLPVVSRQTLKTIEIAPEEMKPGRLADHAFAGRVLALTSWAVLGLTMLAVGLYRYRVSVMTCRLSTRMAELVRPRDHALMMALGILLPVIYYLAIYRLTPLGGREWSLNASAFIVPAGQFGAMLWLMIVVPVMVARRLVGLRAGAAGLQAKQSRVPWVAVAFGVIALPVFGVALMTGVKGEAVLIAAGALLGVLQLYWLVVGFRALSSSQGAMLRRVTISRVLLPTYAAGMLVMVLAMPLYHLEEKHWFPQDRLFGYSVEEPSMTRYEYRVTQALREELLDIMKETP